MAGHYDKYTIAKSDGSEVDPDADYFVLRLDTDQHARDAITLYAIRVSHQNLRLAYDLVSRVLMHERKERQNLETRRALEEFKK